MNGYYGSVRGTYCISTDPSRIDTGVLHRYLSEESYWARGIPLAVVEKSLAHSLCFGLYEQEKMIGFARLVTDRSTFAWLADVFILETCRGKGLSKWLLETIQAHPELQGLRRWILATRDAHGLYEQFGWLRPDEEACGRLMQRHVKDVYAGGPSPAQ